MTWQPPDVSHLLDQRLQTARLELMQDSRIVRAQGGLGSDTTPFLRSLINEKLAAAARSGLGAIDASLRASAAAYLAERGHDSGRIRESLDVAGRALTDLHGLNLPTPHSEVRRPIQSAGMFYLAWITTITIGWLSGDRGSGLYLVLAGGGVFVAVGIFFYAYGSSQKRRRALVNTFPTRVCRDYLDYATTAIEGYTAEVNSVV